MGLCSLPFTYLGQTMVEVMKIMATSLQRSHAHTATPSALNPVAGHPRPMPPLETPGHLQASLGQSLVGGGWGGGHCSFLLGPGAHKVLSVPSKSLFPQSCVILAALCGVNGNLLQEGLRCTQVCCTQSPCLCGSPLLPVPPQENYTLLYQQKSMSKMDKMHLHLS